MGGIPPKLAAPILSSLRGAWGESEVQALLSDHVLLPGGLLYQAREQRFYLIGSPLTPLSGGPPLAPAPDLANRPWWPYHLAGR